MKKYNNNFQLRLTVDLTFNARRGHMVQNVKLSIFESLELQWSWNVSMVQTFKTLYFWGIIKGKNCKFLVFMKDFKPGV